MSKEEIEKLSDEDLLKEWKVIKTIFNSSMPQNISKGHQIILFANFVNICEEIAKRKLTTDE